MQRNNITLFNVINCSQSNNPKYLTHITVSYDQTSLSYRLSRCTNKIHYPALIIAVPLTINGQHRKIKHTNYHSPYNSFPSHTKHASRKIKATPYTHSATPLLSECPDTCNLSEHVQRKLVELGNGSAVLV